MHRALPLLPLLLFGVAHGAADPSSPVGAWRTFDDATKKPKSVVRIIEKDGSLIATVIS